MGWIYLVIAGGFEILLAIAIKKCEGIHHIFGMVCMFSALLLSLAFFNLAVKTVALGTAYALWTGIGTVGIAIYGIYVVGESTSALRIICIMLIVLGMIGLRSEHE